MAFQNKPETKSCGLCGKPFECRSRIGGCWCEGLPPLGHSLPSLDCLCPDCLRKEIEKHGKADVP